MLDEMSWGKGRSCGQGSINPNEQQYGDEVSGDPVHGKGFADGNGSGICCGYCAKTDSTDFKTTMRGQAVGYGTSGCEGWGE